MIGHGHFAFSVTLASNEHASAIQVDTLDAETRHLPHAQTRPVEKLEHRPIAQDDSISATSDGGAIVIDVLANDSDADGNPLSVTAVTQPVHGSAQIGANKITYTPVAGYVGSDQFTYTISDNKGLSASARINVTVNAKPASPPIARDDSTTTAYNTPVTINVLANDTDADGNPISITAVTQPAHGSTRIDANRITYTPAAGYAGSDQFAYTIGDDKGLSASAKVNVTVNADPVVPPVARNDSATTPYNTPVTIDVLANDSDPGGLPLTINSVGTPAHGAARVNTNGSITYTPQQNFSGSDSFAYSIGNSKGGRDGAIVTVIVQPQVLVAPIAQNDSATTAYNTPVTINVLANDTDPNGFALTLTSVGAPAHGSATANANGTITYAPAASFNGGTDSFTYVAGNGHGGSASATVSINVTAAAVNGLCGSANGQGFSAMPVANLCSVGTASAVIGGASQWTWTCAGRNGGTTASCAANRLWKVVIKTMNAICTNNGSTDGTVFLRTGQSYSFFVPSVCAASASGCPVSRISNTVTAGPVTADCSITVYDPNPVK